MMTEETGQNFKIVALPKVKEQHLPGVFGDFSTIVNQRINELKQSKRAVDLEKGRFFEYLLNLVDASQYRAIQARFLDPKVLDKKSDLVKYLDPIIWFESKLALALRLGLDKSAPRRILDLGTGPAHFPVVATYFGHDVTGTDLPRRTLGASETGHLYDALAGAYKVKRIGHIIKPGDDLRALKGPYDLVTSFLTAFNVDEKKAPWSVDSWDTFLGHLQENVLSPDGGVFMSLTNKKLTPVVWTHLKRLATWALDDSKLLYIPNLAVARKKAPARGKSTAVRGKEAVAS